MLFGLSVSRNLCVVVCQYGLCSSVTIYLSIAVHDCRQPADVVVFTCVHSRFNKVAGDRQNMPLREHQLTHCAHLSTWLFALVRGWHAGNPVTSAGCKSRFNIGGNSHQSVHRRGMCITHRRRRLVGARARLAQRIRVMKLSFSD